MKLFKAIRNAFYAFILTFLKADKSKGEYIE